MYIPDYSIGRPVIAMCFFSTGIPCLSEKKGPVNQVFDSFKQIGATIIISVIIVMMAITFSSQPKHEIMNILSGGDRLGEFRGEEIRPEVYRFVAESCKSRFQVYGSVPDAFIQQCISNGMKQLLILPAVARDSGLDVSEKSVKDQLVETIRMREAAQAQSRLEEDRLPVQELYRREILGMPIDLRIRMQETMHFEEVYGGAFPVSNTELDALSRAAESRLELQVVSFTNADMLARFKAEASDDEMRPLYEKDRKEAELMAKKEGVNRPYPTFEQRRDFLRERVIMEKKKKQLEDLKTSLGAIRGDTALEKVAEAVHARPERVQTKIGGMDAIALSSGRRLNLTGTRFVSDLSSKDSRKEALMGPYQDGETTVYLRVLKVDLAREGSRDRGKMDDARRMALTGAYVTNIMDEYAKAGKFRLRGTEPTKEE